MKQLPVWMHNGLNRLKRAWTWLRLIAGTFAVWWAVGTLEGLNGAWLFNCALMAAVGFLWGAGAVLWLA